VTTSLTNLLTVWLFARLFVQDKFFTYL